MRRRVLIAAAGVVLVVVAGLAAYALLGGQSVDWLDGHVVPSS